MVISHDEVPSRDPVARSQAHRAGQAIAVQQRPIFSAEVADVPVVPVTLERKMLSRKTRVIGEIQLRGARPSQRNVVALQLDSLRLTIRTLDSKLSGARGGHQALVYRRWNNDFGLCRPV